MSIEKAKNGNEAAEHIPAAEARLAANREQLELNLNHIDELLPERKEGMLAKIKQFGDELLSSSLIQFTVPITIGIMMQGVSKDPITNGPIFDMEHIASTAEVGGVVIGMIVLGKLAAKLMKNNTESSVVGDLLKRYKFIPKQAE